MDYLDFDLALEKNAAGGYRARVLNSPAGQAVHDFALPFNDLEIENFLLRIGRPRAALRRVDSPESEALKQFGGRLFRAVFDDEALACLRSSSDIAQEKNMGLRLRLRFVDAGELSDLPWETLYNPALNRFLSLSRHTPVVRFLELPERVRPCLVQPPFKVLVIIASPGDYPALDVEREWVALKEAVASLEQSGRLALTRLPEASLRALQHQLRQDSYHILHFIGHGGFNEQTQDGLLLFENEDGLGYPVSGQDLGVILHDHGSIRLAVLNACEGGRASRSDPFSGTAQALVQQGIPAVAAMQFEISDEAAVEFGREFYTALTDFLPVDAALTEARKTIFASGSAIEWCTPVLYLRAPDGEIFANQPALTAEAQPAAPLAPGRPVDRPSAALPGSRAAASSARPKGRNWRLIVGLLILLALVSLPAGLWFSSHFAAALPTPGLTASPDAPAVLAQIADTPTAPPATAAVSPSSTPPASTPPPSATPPPPSLTTTDICPIEAVEHGQALVLAARFSEESAPPNAESQILLEDLQQQLVSNVPYPSLAVRAYPQEISSQAQARQVAADCRAAVILWGRKNNSQLELEVQIGDLSTFERLRFPRQTLERTANVHVRLTDARQQSVARQVLALLLFEYMADGDGAEAMRMVLIAEMLDGRDGAIVTGGVAGLVHRFSVIYPTDLPQSINEITQAIQIDSGNALLYMLRSTLYGKSGSFALSHQDSASAIRLGPADWTLPLYIEGNVYLYEDQWASAIPLYDRIIALNPHDWFAYNQRGSTYLVLGDLGRARADLDQALALEPTANFPYVWATLLALRQARLEEARQYIQTMLVKFPDPVYGERVLRSLVTEDVKFVLQPAMSAFGKLIIGQYAGALQDTQAALTIKPEMADLYLMEGLTYCNLNQLTEAEEAYTQGISLAPDFALLYLLHAEVALRQGETATALQDLQTLQANPLAPNLAAYIQLAQTGQFNCKNLFSAP